MKKRLWSTWPTRLVEKFNSYSGLATAGGTIITVAGLNLDTPGAKAITGFGILLFLISFCYSIYKSIPKKLVHPSELVGKNIAISELELIYPKILSLAIVGPSQAGKTTLKDRITFTTSEDIRTQSTSAHIVSLQTSPAKYIALLDGGGEQYAHQFKLIETCDCALLMLDHNKSDHEIEVSEARLIEHEEFLRQLRNYLDDQGCAPKKWIKILINKYDLWKDASDEQRALIESMRHQQLTLWREGNRATQFEAIEHSNENPTFTARLVTRLIQSTTN